MKTFRAALVLLLFCLLAFRIQAQEGKLLRTQLFIIPTEKFSGAAGYTFRIAADSEERIAFCACSRPFVYLFDKGGNQIDSVRLPDDKCVRALEFDENDRLLIMDNDETRIFRYDLKRRQLETLPYQKPEDWFKTLNHYYRAFELSSIPTYYSNNDYLQDFYFTRFTHSYNLYLSYDNGHIYQVHYNLIRKIQGKTSFSNSRKEDIWLSDNITPKSKLLLVDDNRKSVVYYDRFYNLIYENTVSGQVYVNAALGAGSEPARFDYCTNINQQKIFGISAFNKRGITISSWTR